MDKIISMAGIHLYKDKSRYKQNLMDDLKKHGNLKLAIKNLKGKQIVLKSQKRYDIRRNKERTYQQSKTKHKKKIAT